jgi:DNA-directed RNA polymerase specialized sigma24 family protein
MRCVARIAGRAHVTFDELLTHPEVIATIVYILRSARIPTQELQDGVQQVELKMLQSQRNKPQFLWPNTLPAMKALARKTAETYVIDRWRKNNVDMKAGNLGLIVEDLDEHEAPSRHPSERHPMDHKTAFDLLEEVVTKSKQPELTRRVVEGLYEGKGQTEIATELGLPAREIRDHVAQIRRRFSRIRDSVLGVGALSVGLFFGVRALHPGDGGVATGVPHKSAAELRNEAEPFCRRAEWDECLRRLDSAAELDPRGDRTPEIRKVRDEAARQQKRDE